MKSEKDKDRKPNQTAKQGRRRLNLTGVDNPMLQTHPVRACSRGDPENQQEIASMREDIPKDLSQGWRET